MKKWHISLFSITIIFSSAIFSSACVYAQNQQQILTFLKPPEDQLLLDLVEAFNEKARNISLHLYQPLEQNLKEVDVTRDISKGKEAYEFLKFEEAISLLTKAISFLQTHLNSQTMLNNLKEAQLYLAMSYLALDRSTDAQNIVDNYLCISGTTMLSSDLWPPSLIDLIKNRAFSLGNSAIPITFTTDPSEANLSIDGNSQGITPVKIKLLPCVHYLNASKDGYISYSTTFMVTSGKQAINIQLMMDPFAISDNLLRNQQIKSLLQQYQTDSLLILSNSLTQTTFKTVRINAKLLTGQPLTTRTLVFTYRDREESIKELLSFLVAPENADERIEVSKMDTGQGVFNQDKEQHAIWHKNKWLWVTGGAIIAAVTTYIITENNNRSSQSTGSISIKW